MTRYASVNHRKGEWGGRAPLIKALLAVLLALLVAALVLVPLSRVEAAVNRKAVAQARTADGLPSWYQDANGIRVTTCTDDPALCAIEDPTVPQGEIVYWAGEASMPVGVGGQARLVMAVEGSFMNPDGTDAQAPGPDTIPLTGSVILARATGLRPNTVYKISHPYGVMKSRTDDRGRFRKIIEHGCDLEGAGETCNFNLALQSPVFGSFLRWDPSVAPKAPAGFLGDPEVAHRVVGSPVKNRAGNPQNYFRIEGPRAGGAGKTVAGTNRFSITGQVINPLPTDITLSAKPAKIKAGRATWLTGKLGTILGQNLAGKSVVITRKVAGTGTFRAVPGGRLTTRADGSFTLRVANVRKSTVYRVQFAGERGELWPSGGSTFVRVMR